MEGWNLKHLCTLELTSLLIPRGRKAGATNQGELGCCDLHHSVLEGAAWSTTISEVSLELLEPRNKSLYQLSKGKENDFYKLLIVMVFNSNVCSSNIVFYPNLDFRTCQYVIKRELLFLHYSLTGSVMLQNLSRSSNFQLDSSSVNF